MAASFDDDDFDDDTFDNLPASTLHALESRAFVAKKQQYPPSKDGPSLGVQPLLARPPAPGRPPLSTGRPQVVDPKQDDGGIIQVEVGAEEVINLDDYAAGKQNTYSQFRTGTQPSRYPKYGNGSVPKNGINVPFRPPGRSSQSSQPARPQQTSGAQDYASLQAQIERLEREKAELKALADGAEAKAQAKTGEASILRQRIEKTSRDYEHQLDALRQTHQDNAVRQKAELEALKKQREKVETDRRFLEHDLALEVSKAKTRKVPAVIRSHTLPEAQQSPKRARTLDLGDGFNDEIPTGSPSRARLDQTRSCNGPDLTASIHGIPSSPAKSWSGFKVTTPSKRAEKKRKFGDLSPARTKLVEQDLLAGSSPIQLFSPDPSFEVLPDDDTIGAQHESEQLDFIKSVLFYRLGTSGERFLETMKNYTFAISSSTLSACIMDCWDQSSPSKDVAMDFCHVVCSIWDTCLEQKLYAPIDHMVNILYFAVSKNDAEFSRRLISRIVPPLMKSVNEVAMPIASNRMDDAGPTESVSGIDTRACLDLLICIAEACSGHDESATELWTILTLHWTLVLLFPMQPLHHLSMTCALLRSSAMDKSFGPVFQSSEFDTVKDQSDLEGIIVDRLTSLLSTDVRAADTSTAITLAEMLEFRLEILQTLIVLCEPPRTGLPIAKHRDAIGRMFRFLLDTVDCLYRPDTTIKEVHDLVVDCINTMMRILYAVLTTHADIIDIHEKLKAVDGGAHTQLLALTRIAFCESVILEHGIDPSVSDAAHALLDEFLSPVEGDQLLKMFPSIESTALGNDTAGVGGRDALTVSVNGTSNEPMDLT